MPFVALCGQETISRGPQAWSVERSVSNPWTSEPQPSNAAEWGTSASAPLSSGATASV